jgi:hypothetical protein
VTRRSALLLAGLLSLPLGWSALRLLGAGGEAQADVARPDEVLIVVVGSRSAVREVREAVDPERIVANSLDGFALREGRVVVASAEAAGGLLGLAGWTDAQLEIVAPRPGQRRPTAAEGSPASELAALLAKPTLTPAEAIRALQLLR